MKLLQLKLFAGFQLIDAQGEPLLGISRKAKALLAWLALNPDQEYPREKLAGILWPDSHETQARHSLRQALSSLRKILPSEVMLLQTTKDWILLDTTQIKVDVHLFEQEIKKSVPASFDKAIALYRGNLLEGCNPSSDSFDDWLFGYRNNYRELAVSTIEKRLRLLLKERGIEQKNEALLLRYAKRLIEIDELQELAYQALMIVYHKKGHHRAALETYKTIKNKLQQQLSISPTEETNALYREIVSPRSPIHSSSIEMLDRLARTKKRRLSNSSERLLYQIDLAIEGVALHTIGHSFLIRGERHKTQRIAEEIVKKVRVSHFSFCQKEISTDPNEQHVLTELLEVLSIYLTDSKRLNGLQADHTISLRSLSMLKSISTQQPLMILVQQIHHSHIDLMVQLAELASLIGNHAVLLIMLGDVGNTSPLDIIWQNAMIGAPMTTIDI